MPKFKKSQNRAGSVQHLTCSQQTGFTLIEMLVAMVIFAMLTVAGWQVFDTLNRSKDRANIHADYLSQLQYAYLQLQNDMNQVVAWNTIHNEKFVDHDTTSSTNNGGKNGEKNGENPIKPEEKTNKEPVNNSSITSYETPPFFELSSQSLSFLRFLDPDPRYKSSATLGHITYALQGNALVRSQSNSAMPAIGDSANANSNINSNGQVSSVVLQDIEQMSWQALIPEPTSEFSAQENGSKKQTNNSNNMSGAGNSTKNGGSTEKNSLLPHGIKLSFVYQDMPIEWVFSLSESSPNMNNE